MVRCSRDTHWRRDGEQVVVVGRSPVGQVPAEARLDQQRAQLRNRQRQQPPRLLGRCNKQKVNRRSAEVFRGSSFYSVRTVLRVAAVDACKLVWLSLRPQVVISSPHPRAAAAVTQTKLFVFTNLSTLRLLNT